MAGCCRPKAGAFAWHRALRVGFATLSLPLPGPWVAEAHAAAMGHGQRQQLQQKHFVPLVVLWQTVEHGKLCEGALLVFVASPMPMQGQAWRDTKHAAAEFILRFDPGQGADACGLAKH